MADLVQTAANVQSGTGALLQERDAAVTLIAGNSVFVNAAGLLDLADQNDTVAEANAAGICVNGGGPDQPVKYQVAGRINLGVALVAGETYVVGATPGAISPVGDIAAAEFSTILGIAISVNEIEMGLNPSGIAHG